MKTKKLLFISLLIASFFIIKNVKSQTTVVDIIVNSAAHDTLEAAVVAAGLADDLSGDGPFTVFAPTDDAFKALPAGTLEALLANPAGDLANILLYHVVGAKAMSTNLSDGQFIKTLLGKDIKVTINEEGVFINNAKVTVADLNADNGVVHVIDAVLLPPTVTVVDIIVNSEAHDTLEAAVVAAGLADDLSGDGPFTVFAPTDDAFKALPAGTLEALLANPAGDLANILLYHVVGAKAMSTDLSNGQTIETLLGEEITVSISAQGVFINNAKVIMADILADNGVVHVIDAVLLPPVPTGIANLKGEFKSLNIYPNPAKDFVHITGIDAEPTTSLKVVNMNGQVILNRILSKDNAIIDVRSLPKGSYMVIVNTIKETYTGKLIVR